MAILSGTPWGSLRPRHSTECRKVPSDELSTVLIGEAPCDNCRHAERCRVELLACDAFALYAKGGSAARWQQAPRIPTAERFEQVFGREAA